MREKDLAQISILLLLNVLQLSEDTYLHSQLLLDMAWHVNLILILYHFYITTDSLIQGSVSDMSYKWNPTSCKLKGSFNNRSSCNYFGLHLRTIKVRSLQTFICHRGGFSVPKNVELLLLAGSPIPSPTCTESFSA